MATLSFIIGIIGNVISILVFASPIGTFRRIVKKKSTENYKGIPYITTLLSTSLWSFYGILKPGGLLVLTVNGAGAVMQFIYVTLFLIYAPKEVKKKSMKLVGVLDVGFLGVVIAVTLLALHGSFRLTFVGVLCAGLTIGMYASPLSVMRMVIKTKSVEYMPFLLSFFLFLNAGVWSAYALLVEDFFIGVPNAVGFVLGSAQLILYAVYRKKSRTPVRSEGRMNEAGSAQLVKRAVEMQVADGAAVGEAGPKNHSLSKGRSLPKPPISRQYSIKKIVKTLSLDLQNWEQELKDVENGDYVHNHH